ncbi:hypothetical protein NE237_030368 [Protea cynaroides]|uniref:DYW domain-containing protein n=1 Tax=Protea cynaroides TaxID=273540 RepID=A0A9Q0JVQ5_9MAGN|nr:hypothetical protein NE237_030368 [Protea cynaroides]
MVLKLRLIRLLNAKRISNVLSSFQPRYPFSSAAALASLQASPDDGLQRKTKDFNFSNLYADVGDILSSSLTFERIRKKNIFTWHSMISSYVRNGCVREALDCYYQLLTTSNVRPDFFTLPVVLKACNDLKHARKIHCWVLKLGFDPDVFVAASSIHKDSRLGLVDLGSWNAMIYEFCQNGEAAEALDVFEEMNWKGCFPVCAPLNDLVMGMLIHMYVIKHGLDFDVFVSNALINMYFIFDQMVVRDLVSWNSIISAHEQNNDIFSAIDLFVQMKLNGFKPDLLTLVSLASIVSQSGDCQNSRALHGFIVRQGWLTEDTIRLLICMLNWELLTLQERSLKDVISSNTLITGLYSKWSCKPRNIGKHGMRIHGRSIKTSLHVDVFVGTCLIDMYSKCGKLDDAMYLFLEMPQRSSVPWNAIISSHGIHGHDKGVKPDHVTFVSLLSACSHVGLVEQGQWCFQLMQEGYGIIPSLKHYGCMVDLLGRAGQLDSAYEFIRSIPVKPEASIWGAFLGACRIHGNVELGAFASNRLFEVDSENAGYYVVDNVRSLAKSRGLKKTPGWRSVELNNKVHVFYTGNQSHRQIEEIYNELRVLLAKMKSLGYVPDFSFMLQDVAEDEKEHILMSHSERLAIAFGIINNPPKTPIRIFKNLWVCGDCHNTTKLISKIIERELIVRDSNRFHLIKDGNCSCGDYW